ncbi:hypothetical protein [Roseivivax sp. CAU 1761]
MTFRLLARLAALVALLGLTACGPSYVNGPPGPDQAEIAALAAAIRDLGADVDPGEAERAARIAFTYPLTLAERYEIEDPPVVHNIKVNNGAKPRGLCWHWAEDLQARLAREGFRTLQLHRAIAPPRNVFRLEHSTVILSRRGDGMYDGLVLDPWRFGGVLFWSPTREDARYDWLPRAEVLSSRRSGGEGSETAAVTRGYALP